MRLRLSPELEKNLKDPAGVAETLEGLLNDGSVRIFNQRQHRRTGTGWVETEPKTVLTVDNGAYKLVLAPARPRDDAEYRIVWFRPVTRRDRVDSVHGRLLPGPFIVVKPTKSQLAEFAVEIHPKKYWELAGYLKAPLNMAWGKLKAERRVRKTTWEGVVLMHFTGPSPSLQENKLLEQLDASLTDTGVGRVINDPYEVRKIRELCDLTCGP
jgi:hypothetical protein